MLLGDRGCWSERRRDRPWFVGNGKVKGQVRWLLGGRVMGRGGAFIGRTGLHDIEGKLER